MWRTQVLMKVSSLRQFDLYNRFMCLLVFHFQMFNYRKPNIEVDFSHTDGDDDDDKTLEKDGIRYRQRSWYFIHNSTIKGRHKQVLYVNY